MRESGKVPAHQEAAMAGSTPDSAGPLAEADLTAVRRAVELRKPLIRAARIAHSSAIITLVIAACALLCLPLWPSVSGLIVTAGLIATGIIEYKASGQLLLAKPGSARVLGRNQLCLLGVIVLYCAIQMFTFSIEDAKNAALSPETRSQLNAMPGMQKSIDQLIENWAPIFNYGLYGAVIIGSVFCQGGLALYYFRRQRILEEFNASTPPWVQRMLVEAAG